jgi:hypothetical protein
MSVFKKITLSAMLVVSLLTSAKQIFAFANGVQRSHEMDPGAGGGTAG